MLLRTRLDIGHLTWLGSPGRLRLGPDNNDIGPDDWSVRAGKHKRLCNGKPSGCKQAHATDWNGRQLASWDEVDSNYPPVLPESTDLVERRIIHDVSDLGNFVLATQAMQSLARCVERGTPNRILLLTFRLQDPIQTPRNIQLDFALLQSVAYDLPEPLQATDSGICA